MGFCSQKRAEIHIILHIHGQRRQHLIFIPTNFKQIKHYGHIYRIMHNSIGMTILFDFFEISMNNYQVVLKFVH